MFTGSNSDKRGLHICEQCKSGQKICHPQFEESHERCAACMQDGIKCSFESGPSPISNRSTSEMMKRFLWQDLARSQATTASSSVDSSRSWGQHSWATTAPSSYSSNMSENIPILAPPHMRHPNKLIDTGLDPEQYLSTSPFNYAGYRFDPSRARSNNDTLADSGFSSTEQSQPSSPLASPTVGKFRRVPPKRRALSRDLGTFLPPPDGQLDHLEASDVDSVPKTGTSYFTQTPLVWRGNLGGQPLLLKGHGAIRPLPLKTDIIKKRNRRNEFKPSVDISCQRSEPLNARQKNYFLNSPEEKKPNTTLSARDLLISCTQQCAIVVRRLEDLEKIDKEDTIGLMLPLALSVVNLRLHLWGQIAAGPLHNFADYYSSADHPLQTLVKINGISCELEVVVNTLLQDAQGEPTRPSRAWDKVSKLFQELIILVNILHNGLSDLWRETTQWALVADLLVHRTLDEISHGLRARSGGSLGSLFTTSLGAEVPRNLSSMLALLDNRIGTSAPMSYEYGLLDPNDLADQGWFDPGIRVYIQRSSNGSSKRGLISVDIVTYNGTETPKQAMDSQSALGLQKRLQLHKPDEFRVLALAGYLENTAMRQVEILCQAPEWALPPYTPISLFQLAAEGKLPTCMSTRIAIARKLMCAVFHFHTSDWIHGNIVEHNIIFFTSEAGLNLLEPFLCNFAPHPVKDASKCGSSRVSEEFREARYFDIYQMALVISGLVLEYDVVRRLRAFEFPLAPSMAEFEGIINQPALVLLKNTEAVSLFKDAVWNCISGIAALEGIIEQDEVFSKHSGFYWRVVRPLDHCLSLLVKDMHSSDVEQTGLDRGRCPTDRETSNRYPYQNEVHGNPSLPMQSSATTMPKDSPDVLAPIFRNMRSGSRRLQQVEKSEASVLEDRKRILGEDHPEVLISMGRLVLSYLEQRQFTKADDLLVDFLRALKVSALAGHRQILITTINLAISYRSLGGLEMAGRLEGMVLEAKKTIEGKSHPDTVCMQEHIVQSSQRKLASPGPGITSHKLGTETGELDPDDVPVTYLTLGVTPLFDTKQPKKASEHTIQQISKHPMDLARDTSTTQKPNTIDNEDRSATRPVSKVNVDPQGKKKVYPVQAAASTINTWQQTLLPQLEKILEHLPKTESASLDLLGIGTSRESSRPTIVVTCDSVRQVKGHLQKRFAYDKNIFDLKIRKGSVRRSTGRRAREKRNSKRRSTGSFYRSCPNRAYQQKPLSGASIGACLDGKPLPPGTYGGLILVDGLPYGATVHHLIDPESEGEEGGTDDEDGYGASEEGVFEDTPRSPNTENLPQFEIAFSNSDVDSMSICWDDSDESSDGEEFQYLSDAEEFGTMYYSSTTGDIQEADINAENSAGDVGDIPGFPKNHDKDIVITQPAQDDVPDPESFECEQGIGTYKLGTILASSGIRRVTIGSEKHEMDWALVQIEQQRLVARNIIRGGGKYLRRPGPPDLEPCAIVPMTELSELRVHATGRTSGLQGGMISQAMSSVKLHGRETFSKSWHVVGNLGIPGDSGSWVVDNDSGRVCGHVIARCSIKRVSYIVPMELLLEDIKETLGAKSVRLPSVATEVDQLLDEALAQFEMIDNGSNSRREIKLLCPGPEPSAGGSDEITPLAY